MKKRILHVEDELFDQMLLTNLIEEEALPYSYTAARSVHEARQLLESESFDIAILDYLLGDGTALELLDCTNDTPVIILSAVTDTDVAIKAIKDGVSDYLIKDKRQKYLNLIPAAIENALKRKKYEERLLWQHRFEKIIADISSSFVHLTEKEIDKGIQEGLDKLSHFLCVDESFIALFNKKLDQAIISYKCHNREELFSKNRKIKLDTAIGEQLVEMLEKFQIFSFSSNDPADTEESQYLKRRMAEKYIHSLVVVPMIDSGCLFGALVFIMNNQDNSNFTEEKLNMFHLASEQFSNLIQRKKAESTQHTHEERYLLALQGSGNGIWDWDIQNNTLYLSPQSKSILGINDSTLLLSREGRDKLLSQKTHKIVHQAFNKHLCGQSTELNLEISLKQEEDPRWVEIRGLAYRNLVGEPQRMAGTITDITERKMHEQRLLDEKLLDPLSGLFNRQFIIHELHKLIHASKRYKHPLCAAIMDIRNFKTINTEYSRQVGDEILAITGKIIADILRSSDIAARSYADVFYIIFPHTSATRALTSIKRIQKRMNKYHFYFNRTNIEVLPVFALADFAADEMTEQYFLEYLNESLKSAKKANPYTLTVNKTVQKTGDSPI